MTYGNIREESLKLKVASDWFPKFDCTDIINRIDFAVKIKRKASATDGVIDFGDEYLLWAEAKNQPTDIYRMLTQLLVTVRQDAKNLNPPKFIGCFDNEKIAFVEYHHILPIFNINDFNWTQTPSAVDDKSIESVKANIDADSVFTFNFDADHTELLNFVKQNFILDENANLLSTQIDKNNFVFIYQKWRSMVMPYIDADWEKLKKNYSIYDRDFFLAELNIDDNGTTCVTDDRTIDANFFITFNAQADKPYMLKRTDAMGLDFLIPFGFKNKGLAQYTDFWKRYKRPPQNDYWHYIVERLDLLVPQDVRERKGAYFTPQIWVEKSQQYIADVLGADWQDEYYVWDCCAGTGNLLNGLTNKYNIWASTIDQQDVDVMKERIGNGANLLENHVFQFDFLNDDFSKLPVELQKIVNDENKRKKLVIYINPPYAESASRTTVTGTGENKKDVAVLHKTYKKYLDKIGIAGRELFVQFFIRIYFEISGCVLAQFSKLKHLQAPNFADFRNVFKAKLETAFIVPSYTFDNVKGRFPIGFFIWNCGDKQFFTNTISDVFDENGNFIQNKLIEVEIDRKSINDWIISTRNRIPESNIGYMSAKGADFTNQNYNFIINDKMQLPHPRGSWVTDKNTIEISVYIAVRQCIPATWLNDRDQFLYPNDGWKTDNEFQSDCLAYTLFHGQNRITSHESANHWIPFTESEVEARERFESHFMVDFMNGKIKPENQPQADLFATQTETFIPTEKMQFSAEATAVFDAGRELWRYYHAQPNVNVNASLYDIKEYFQGRNDKGKMNNSSSDVHYNELVKSLREALKILARKIEPKVYEYGFLK